MIVLDIIWNACRHPVPQERVHRLHECNIQYIARLCLYQQYRANLTLLFCTGALSPLERAMTHPLQHINGIPPLARYGAQAVPLGPSRADTIRRHPHGAFFSAT